MMNPKKLVAGVALAGTLVVGTAGIAAAQTPSPPAGGVSGQAVPHPLVRHVVRAAARIVLGVTGGTPQELRAYLQGGGTLAQWASAHGSTPQAVASALVQAADARIDRAVANGKLDATRAARIKERVPTVIDRLMNRTWGQHRQI